MDKRQNRRPEPIFNQLPLWEREVKLWRRAVYLSAIRTTHPLEITKKTLYPHIYPLYPQLSTLYPHLGGKEGENGHFHPRQLRLGLLLNSGGEFVDLVIDRTALSHELTDLSICMHNCRVVAAAESLTNFWK